MAKADYDLKLNQLHEAGFFRSIEINRGIEKESLRVNSLGIFQQTIIPKA